MQVAPVTSQHILKLAKLGAYNTVSFFRVDKGFVAQTADVVYGRLEGAPLDARQLVRTAFHPHSSYHPHAPMQTSLSCMLPGKQFTMARGKPAETRPVTMKSCPAIHFCQTCYLLQAEGKKTVPLEVQKDIIHNKRGILSMGRHSDPNSGGSSFSILLGPAPHLDQEYTIFGCAPKQCARHWQGWS